MNNITKVLVISANLIFILTIWHFGSRILEEQSRDERIDQVSKIGQLNNDVDETFTQIPLTDVTSMPYDSIADTSNVSVDDVNNGYEIDICYEGECYNLSSLAVEWIKEDYTEERVQWYSDRKIKEFFEKKFFKQSVAQNSKGLFLYVEGDSHPNLEEIENYLYSAVNTPNEDRKKITVNMPSKEYPGTDGLFAKRYIEVDNSRQRLYAWVDGKVIKTISLSGPKYGYQVYGVFPIVDKGIEPIAPGGLYMPYWMAFHYAKKQESWYGLHGLIWWYDQNNNRVYEPLTNIGVRRSAGCIRMLVEDAKFLYDIYQKGDPVLIHE